MRKRDVEPGIGPGLRKKHRCFDFHAMLQVVPVVPFCQVSSLR